jgi:hypothetical protein
MGRKRSANYIDPKEFYDEMVISLEKDELTPRAVELCQLLIDRVSKCNHYDCIEDEEDCKAHAMFNILRYWRNFNPEKYDNPFNYFTSYAWTGLAQGWNTIHPEKERDFTKVFISTLEDVKK